jgi:hypothetical protein
MHFKMQKAIAEANGLSVAADFIEESVGTRRKVRNSAGLITALSKNRLKPVASYN